MADILLHHLESSRSHRILWLLEELGLEYDIKRYGRDKKMRADKALRAIHPLGKAPLVTIGDEPALAESAAIMEELLDRYGEGRLRPEPGSDAYRSYRYWMFYAEGSLAAPLLVKFNTTQLRIGPMPFFVRPIAKAVAGQIDKEFTNGELKSHFDFLEQHLAKNDYLAGDTFTAADILMAFPLQASVERGITGDRPAIAAWVAKMKERPAFQKAEEIGGPAILPSR
jgi:glutathione S-transferase